jgi:adenine-specific DNA-methyltransferase
MPKYTCENCNKMFTQKGHLEDHNNRKRPCKKDNTIDALVEKKVLEVLSKTNTQDVKIDRNKAHQKQSPPMDYSKKTREELIALCKEKGIKGYSGKKKTDILQILTASQQQQALNNEIVQVATVPSQPQSKNEKISRLNYIGSKFQLLDWISTTMKQKTSYMTFQNNTIADLFAGTGVVSHYFRNQNANVISNDAELYSSIITHAFTRSTYNETCKSVIESLQQDLNTQKYVGFTGYITTHYSPHNGNERKFFTIDNAQRIDYIRKKLDELAPTMNKDDNTFLLASLLISADAVSNVPAVYGCFLKQFKAKATKALTLNPIHYCATPASETSTAYNSDVLSSDFLQSFAADIVYLDPPYNERQYSKNYFPLNMIAKRPEKLAQEPPLKGKTGIPQDCFLSPFCKKGTTVENAFEKMFRELRAKWIFLSYNSESIVSKEKMLELMNKYGVATVEEREYKRFKSFEYNGDLAIKEYLFCLKKADA